MIHGLITLPSDRLRNEWEIVDPRLRGALFEMARLMWGTIGKQMWVTDIMRTPQENIDDKGEPDSGHLMQPDDTVRAVDVRVRSHTNPKVGYPGLTSGEITAIIEHWNHNFRHGAYWSCIHHGEGTNRHLHFQVPKR